MRKLTPILAAGFWMITVQAQTADIIGTAGRYGYETGTKGAVGNRQIADQLYKQALADEAAAWRTFPPNASLLSKALQQSKDAKLADDQAKEFARAALHGANTGAQSGEFSNSRYGMISESQLKDLATTNSPYMKQVESKLGSYGMKLSSDQMSLQTPFGKFSVDMNGSAFEKLLGSVATKLGYSAADVTKGLRAAEAARDGIARKTVAAIEREGPTPAGGAGSLPEAEKNLPGRALASVQSEDGAIGSTGGSAMVKDFEEAERPQKSWDEIQMEIMEKRKALGRAIGLQAESDPLGRKNQDIFQMIHVRYQSLRTKGVFIETSIKGR